ncbi:MAG: hypothetical protein GF317_17885 [Candidatus Lokiarchaeota archaeon]|nr:hypothetical protein [Candidatus Lokiarchaeota archaeon]MBD3201384.1 hypothetical protein [Candidatus Lokiarchaeota archaeon]
MEQFLSIFNQYNQNNDPLATLKNSPEKEVQKLKFQNPFPEYGEYENIVDTTKVCHQCGSSILKILYPHNNPLFVCKGCIKNRKTKSSGKVLDSMKATQRSKTKSPNKVTKEKNLEQRRKKSLHKKIGHYKQKVPQDLYNKIIDFILKNKTSNAQMGTRFINKVGMKINNEFSSYYEKFFV